MPRLPPTVMTRVLAGGQSLVPMLSMRMARPKVLVDIMHLPSSADRVKDNAIRVGAGVRQAELLAWPELANANRSRAALPWVGHAQTRSRGTVCGSVAHADPSAEIPLALLALKGEIHLSSRQSERRVSADDFFTGLMSTARKDDELIEAVASPAARRAWLRVPRVRPPARRFRYRGLRGRCAPRTGCGSRSAASPIAPTVRDFRTLDGAALDDALDDFACELDARDDLHATASYRRNLVRQLGRAAIEEARRCRA